VFLIYKEIFNFKLPNFKILAIEFFDLYSRATCDSVSTTLKIFDLRLLLDLGFISNPRLLNQSLISHVKKLYFHTNPNKREEDRFWLENK
jgi:hypothetical protein